MSGTAHAVILNTNHTIMYDTTIDGSLTVNADNIILTIPTGVTLTVNGGINAGNYTLTVSGDGTLIVTGTNGIDGDNGGDGGIGFAGNMIVNGTTVQVTGGDGGYGNNDNGGNGGYGIYGNITVNSGSVEVTGGNGGGSDGSGGDGGNGIQGNITVSGGSVTITGGIGGGGDSNGSNGKAVTGSITASSAQESDNNSTWTDIPGTSPLISLERYVKIDITPVTGVSLDKTAITLLSGDTVTLTATVSPDNATSKAVTWTTSDENIASVDQSGDV
ncbi:MAG: Ig-like domain-containing protein, partial [Synergistaceae bacterium]|nr:Ig-like domain-containing protein [Synergistaceae bacterium]